MGEGVGRWCGAHDGRYKSFVQTVVESETESELPVDLRASRHTKQLAQDIDLDATLDAVELDAIMSRVVLAAESSLERQPPDGADENSLPFLKAVLHGFLDTHSAIRTLLVDGQRAAAVHALTLARTQVETLYTFCLLLAEPPRTGAYLKAGWAKKYVRFLVQYHETYNLERYADFSRNTGQRWLSKMGSRIGVTKAEEDWLKWKHLTPNKPEPERCQISDWPSAMGVLESLKQCPTKELLSRLYFEYEYLCSFAHGDAQSSELRILVDPRSPLRHAFPEEKAAVVFQREVAEPAVLYSVLSCLQAATEVLGQARGDVDLAVRVSQSWDKLIKASRLAQTLYDLRGRSLLSINGAAS